MADKEYAGASQSLNTPFFCRLQQDQCLVQEVTETAAMASGKEVHRVLEAEVKKEVDVEMQTKEDAWAVRLLGCIQCFRQLMRRGMTREVYLFGQLQVWLSPYF